MIFENRQQAGELLVKALSHYLKAENMVVLGLPRGGVVTAAVVAKELELPLDVISVRKIGAPHDLELALGAVGTTGEPFLNKILIDRLEVSPQYLEETIAKERASAQERLTLYRRSRPEISLSEKTVILVDDGLATGATMKAAINAARASDATQVVVAVPVSSPETLREIELLADEVICLDTPFFFQAVGQFYNDFSQVENEEVITLLEGSKR